VAYKTLVTTPSPLQKQVTQFLRVASQENGSFMLAMLVPSETGLPDKWNLVLSAHWIDREGAGIAIPKISSLLVKNVSKVNAHKFERISVLPTTDSFVARLVDFQVPLGEVYELTFFPPAEGAFILQAERTEPVNGYRQQRVSTRA
jgi:hypothetical protein